MIAAVIKSHDPAIPGWLWVFAAAVIAVCLVARWYAIKRGVWL